MNKPAVAAIALLSASVLVGAGWWLGRHQAPDALQLQRDSTRPADARQGPDDLDIDANIAAPPAPADEATSSASGSAAAALPPLDTPVDAIFDDLAERARRGDARAACRLAVELQRCRLAGVMGRGTQGLESLAARENDDARRDAIISELARLESERDRSEVVCSGLSNAQLDTAFSFQHLSAQAMPALRSWAAIQPALDFMNFVNELDRWQQYRDTALPWLEAAAADGDLAAISALARVHGPRAPGRMGLPPIAEPDDERLLLYLSLLEQRGLVIDNYQRELERVRASLSPAAQTRMQQQINLLAARMPSEPLAEGPALTRALGAAANVVPDPMDCE